MEDKKHMKADVIWLFLRRKFSVYRKGFEVSPDANFTISKNNYSLKVVEKKQVEQLSGINLIY